MPNNKYISYKGGKKEFMETEVVRFGWFEMRREGVCS